VVDAGTAWLAGLAMMLAVFLYFHHRSGSVRYAFMVSLLWGKILAAAYWVLGFDLAIATVYVVGPYGPVPVATITANQAMLAVLLFSNLLAYTWPALKRELGIRGGELPGLPPRR